MTGVFPVFNNKFKIATEANGEPTATIAEMESFSVAVSGNVEEWTPMTTEGWMKRLMTGKGFAITLSGKRCIGDPGNDYIAGLAWKTGVDCNSRFAWEFPSGATLTFDCVVNVTTPGGGDSTNVDALEAEIMSNGKPTYTPSTT